MHEVFDSDVQSNYQSWIEDHDFLMGLKLSYEPSHIMPFDFVQDQRQL